MILVNAFLLWVILVWIAITVLTVIVIWDSFVAWMLRKYAPPPPKSFDQREEEIYQLERMYYGDHSKEDKD